MPYWRLSAFYFFYFASLGALVPYWGLYLKHLHFSSKEIGVLMAVIMATKIVSPNVWGWIADHTGKRMRIVRAGCLFAALSFALVFVGSDYWWLVLVMVLFSFFWNAALPQFEATTFNYLGTHSHRYSTIRLWGSIGFIVTVAALGPLLDQSGAGVLPGILLLLFVGILLSSLVVPEQAAQHFSLQHDSLTSVLRQPKVLALLAMCFLMQVSHGPYYTFYTIFLEEHDYTRTLIGWLWAVGVIAEVVVFVFMYYLMPRFGVRHLLLLSLFCAAVRWVVVAAFVNHPAVMVAAQILHAATFGIYHACAIQLIHQSFTGRHQGKGQALYSSLSFGAGGALGSFYSGVAWDSLGGETTFYVAAVVALVALMIAWLWIERDARQRR